MVFTTTAIPVFADESSGNAQINENTQEQTVPVGLSAENPGKDDEDIVLFAVESGNISDTLAAATSAIELESGMYTLDGKSDSTSYTQGLTVKTGATAELTIDGVSIEPTGVAPITVESGATLKLTLKGENTLKGADFCSAIAVFANDTTTDYGTLEISGTGKLTATGGKRASGIGSNQKNSTNGYVGKIVINGGTINATGGQAGAGIGVGQNATNSCDIIINGGVITADGGQTAAGIGGVGTKVNAPITINGGTVTATGQNKAKGIGMGASGAVSNANPVVFNGGNINSEYYNVTPVNNEGKEVRKVTLRLPSDLTDKEVEMTVGGMNWKATALSGTDADYSYIYAWVTTDATAATASYNGDTYIIDGATEITTQYTEYDLIKYEGGGCSCTDENTSATLEIADEIKVNVLDGQTTTNLTVIFTGCENPTHNVQSTFELTVDGTAADESLAKVENGKLVTYYAAVGKTIHIKATVKMNSITKIVEKDVTVVGDNSARFNLSDGKIVISKVDGDDTKLSVAVGTNTYTVDKTQTINIYQSKATATNSIEIKNADVTVELEDLNVKTTAASGIKLGTGVNATFVLKGDNIFEAVSASVIENSGNATTKSVTIEGDGSLTATSGAGAGIGFVGKLTVNSGTVNAYGGNGGAGIGGSMDGAGIDVVINGGVVYAKGNDKAAGIGGGKSTTIGGGGNFTMNGGMVKAESGSGDCGIGYGGKTSDPGTITINGGSVNAVLPVSSVRPNNGSPQYLITLSIEGIVGTTDVEYSIGDDPATKIATTTDESGKLYLYVNDGEQWIRVYKGDKTYYRYLKIEKNDLNTATAVIKGECDLKTFEVAGQIESSIDEENKTVTVKVPYNIILDEVSPIATYSASKVLSGEILDFSNSEHTADFVLMGDDKQTKTYTVKLVLDSEPQSPQVSRYDISKGNVIIRGTKVIYGGTSYTPNTAGYEVYGTTNTYTVYTDSSESTLPPITFKDLTIDLSTNALPMTAYASADITIDGKCTLKSATKTALAVSNANSVTDGVKLNFTGNGTLDITTATSGNAMSIGSGCGVSVTGVTAKIVNDGSANAIGGDGKFVTDSETYMRISGSDKKGVRAVNAEGEPLYQVEATLDAEDTTATTCEYNGKTYNIGSEPTLYLMMPAGEYTFNVKYTDEDFNGDTTITNSAVAVTLERIKVTDVTYSATTVEYTGGTVTFTVTGTRLANNVTIKLVPTDENLSTLTAVVGDDCTATITVPENASYENNVTYKVYYVINSKETLLTTKLTVEKNKTVCDLTAFEISGQTSSTITESETMANTVSVNMPFDHEFKNYYTPSKLEFIGKSVSPAADTPTAYTAVDNYMRAVYTVTAKDNATKKEYVVKIYREATPTVTSASFMNPTTCDGGEVEVTISGTAFANIQKAEKAENKKIYIYSYSDEEGKYLIDPVEAKYENGAYTAKLNVPANTSDSSAAKFPLRARIGSTEQTVFNARELAITVPRTAKSETGVKTFTLTGQLGETVIGTNSIDITMPYDADVSAISPKIELTDLDASYTPIDNTDFTSPVTYTVTAENGTTKTDYTVTVTKQAKPVATDIEFTNPDASSAGRVRVKVNGTNLDNAANALNLSKYIMVTATDLSGAEVNATATKDDDGNYIAYVNIPSNETFAEKTYTISVSIGEVLQTLSGNTTLTVPAKQNNECKITDIILAENQGDVVFSDDIVYVYVPYNTDLRNVTPTVSCTGDYEPKTPQNFDSDVIYTVTAEDGGSKPFTVRAIRTGVVKVNSISFDQPETFNDTDMEIEAIGNFIPYITEGQSRDTLEVYAVSRTDATGRYDAEIEYIGYSGKAKCTIELPDNTDTQSDKIYDIKVMLNGVEQTDLALSGVVNVPRRKTRKITEFSAGDIQIGSTNFSSTEDLISFTVPYDANLKSIMPTIKIDGDGVKIGGDTYTSNEYGYVSVPVQNFDNADKTLTYHVQAKNDEDREYKITAHREGDPTITSVVFASPVNFNGGAVEVQIEGVFYNNAAVWAESSDGERINGTIKTFEEGKATAEVVIPRNLSTDVQKSYTLKFKVDDTETAYAGNCEITVPRRTTRLITEFSVPDIQEGDTVIDQASKTISIDVPYVTTQTAAVPQMTFDSDEISPTADAPQNFIDLENPVKYTLSSSGDEDVEYTVQVTLIGEDPYLKTMTVEDQTEETEYDGDNIYIELRAGVDIENVEPIVEFEGMEYSPTGPQDFKNSKEEPVVYTVRNKYGVEHSYYVTIVRRSTGGASTTLLKPTPTPTPEPTATPEPTPTPDNSSDKHGVVPYIDGYDEDGATYFKPDNGITRAEVAKILSILDDDFADGNTYESKFPDVSPSAWYSNYIGFASGKGYISGYEDGTCKPENMITRAEFATMIARYMGITPVETADSFVDISDYEWCQGYINALSELGIVNGYYDNDFRPSNKITRAEAVAVINRAVGRVNIGDVDGIECPFADVTPEFWYYADVLMAACEY